MRTKPELTSARRLAARAPAVAVLILLGTWAMPAPAVTKGAPVPGVAEVEPSHGPSAGGTAVTISGSTFRPGARVTFEAAGATDMTVLAPNRLTAVTPAHPPGRVTVSAMNPGGQSATRGWAFTFDE